MGCAAIMSNGAVVGRVGTAGVAMMAHAHHKPMLFCCETYKFCERMQVGVPLTECESGGVWGVGTTAMLALCMFNWGVPVLPRSTQSCQMSLATQKRWWPVRVEALPRAV